MKKSYNELIAENTDKVCVLELNFNNQEIISFKYTAAAPLIIGLYFSNKCMLHGYNYLYGREPIHKYFWSWSELLSY